MRRLPLSMLVALAACASAAPALADAPVPGLVIDPVAGVPSWQITGMPDLDQLRWDGAGRRYLPNEGRMYCAPTSAANLLAVLDVMHQTDGVIDGTRDWQADANYEDAVTSIHQVGLSMSTDGTVGTGATAAVDGLRSHLSRTARAGGTRVWSRHAFWSSAPEADDLVDLGRNGALAMVSYGVYSPGEDASGVFWERTGGHALSLTSAQLGESSDVGSVTVHDPSTANVIDAVQSPFADDVKSIGARARMRFKWEGDFYTIYVTPWSTSGVRFLEGYIAVYPERLWYLTPGGAVLRLTPEPLIAEDPELDEIPTPMSGAVDAAPTPTGSLLLLGRRGQVMELGSGSGTHRRPARRVATIPGATKVAAMPDGSVITAGPGRVTVLPAEGKRRVFALGRGEVTDVAYDHGRDEIQVLLDGRTVVALTGAGQRQRQRQRQRTVTGKRAAFLDVTATGVVPRTRLVTSAGRTPSISPAGVVRLGGKTWKLPRGSRLVASWVMPDAVRDFPGILDGGKAGDAWEPAPLPNLQVVVKGPGSVAVRNSGPVGAGASILEIVAGQQRTLHAIPALAQGQESEAITTACPSELTARADAKGAVRESVEDDNSVTIACSPAG